ncbi:oligosaccharide flippase family protein [Candidatus Pelagibacter sp.]|nr:oligosaccharide flippase family protein [Candidatus Pelagibacter sp.]
MKIIFKNLITNSVILSIPGLLSILISLLSIPIHLNIAGPESYGNYIIFHFILMMSINLNFGIGKSTVISINNHSNSSKKISFEALTYSKNISIVIFGIWILIYLIDRFLIYSVNIDFSYISYLIFGSVMTIFFITLEGILQGNRKFKTISIFNLFFFSSSLSIPSILLIYKKNLDLNELILLSIIIKFLTIILMFCIIKNNNLITNLKSKILLMNLKRNSQWITLNGILIQFYDLFDKYLIKIFLGPVAVATYSIPQQLTGKLSVISKSISTFLLPDLSKKKKNSQSFEFSIKIIIKFIPIIIFLLMPFYPFILKFWLGSSYNEVILSLTKIFSLSALFSCTSHILVTKFEASKTLNRNLKIEFLLMPLFLISLYVLTSENYSLFYIGFLILIKELLLLFLRLNYLKNEIKNVKNYYFYSIYFLVMLYFSYNNDSLYYLSLVMLILNFFRK